MVIDTKIPQKVTANLTTRQAEELRRTNKQFLENKGHKVPFNAWEALNDPYHFIKTTQVDRQRLLNIDQTKKVFKPLKQLQQPKKYKQQPIKQSNNLRMQQNLQINRERKLATLQKDLMRTRDKRKQLQIARQIKFTYDNRKRLAEWNVLAKKYKTYNMKEIETKAEQEYGQSLHQYIKDRAKQRKQKQEKSKQAWNNYIKDKFSIIPSVGASETTTKFHKPIDFRILKPHKIESKIELSAKPQVYTTSSDTKTNLPTRQELNELGNSIDNQEESKFNEYYNKIKNNIKKYNEKHYELLPPRLKKVHNISKGLLLRTVGRDAKSRDKKRLEQQQVTFTNIIKKLNDEYKDNLKDIRPEVLKGNVQPTESELQSYKRINDINNQYAKAESHYKFSENKYFHKWVENQSFRNRLTDYVVNPVTIASTPFLFMGGGAIGTAGKIIKAGKTTAGLQHIYKGANTAGAKKIIDKLYERSARKHGIAGETNEFGQEFLPKGEKLELTKVDKFDYGKPRSEETRSDTLTTFGTTQSEIDENRKQQKKLSKIARKTKGTIPEEVKLIQNYVKKIEAGLRPTEREVIAYTNYSNRLGIIDKGTETFLRGTYYDLQNPEKLALMAGVYTGVVGLASTKVPGVKSKSGRFLKQTIKYGPPTLFIGKQGYDYGKEEYDRTKDFKRALAAGTGGAIQNIADLDLMIRTGQIQIGKSRDTIVRMFSNKKRNELFNKYLQTGEMKYLDSIKEDINNKHKDAERQFKQPIHTSKDLNKLFTAMKVMDNSKLELTGVKKQLEKMNIDIRSNKQYVDLIEKGSKPGDSRYNILGKVANEIENPALLTFEHIPLSHAYKMTKKTDFKKVHKDKEAEKLFQKLEYKGETKGETYDTAKEEITDIARKLKVSRDFIVDSGQLKEGKKLKNIYYKLALSTKNGEGYMTFYKMRNNKPQIVQIQNVKAPIGTKDVKELNIKNILNKLELNTPETDKHGESSITNIGKQKQHPNTYDYVKSLIQYDTLLHARTGKKGAEVVIAVDTRNPTINNAIQRQIGDIVETHGKKNVERILTQRGYTIESMDFEKAKDKDGKKGLALWGHNKYGIPFKMLIGDIQTKFKWVDYYPPSVRADTIREEFNLYRRTIPARNITAGEKRKIKEDELKIIHGSGVRPSELNLGKKEKISKIKDAEFDDITKLKKPKLLTRKIEQPKSIQSLFRASNDPPSEDLKKGKPLFGFSNIDDAIGWQKRHKLKHIYQVSTSQYNIDPQIKQGRQFVRKSKHGVRQADNEFVFTNVLKEKRIETKVDKLKRRKFKKDYAHKQFTEGDVADFKANQQNIESGQAQVFEPFKSTQTGEFKLTGKPITIEIQRSKIQTEIFSKALNHLSMKMDNLKHIKNKNDQKIRKISKIELNKISRNITDNIVKVSTKIESISKQNMKSETKVKQINEIIEKQVNEVKEILENKLKSIQQQELINKLRLELKTLHKLQIPSGGRPGFGFEPHKPGTPIIPFLPKNKFQELAFKPTYIHKGKSIPGKLYKSREDAIAQAMITTDKTKINKFKVHSHYNDEHEQVNTPTGKPSPHKFHLSGGTWTEKKKFRRDKKGETGSDGVMKQFVPGLMSS